MERNHNLQVLDRGRTISLWGETFSLPERTISPRNVLSLNPGYFSLCTHSAGRVCVASCDPGIFLPKYSCLISLYVACIELVRCHTNMQFGNIDFTCPCVDDCQCISSFFVC